MIMAWPSTFAPPSGNGSGRRRSGLGNDRPHPLHGPERARPQKSIPVICAVGSALASAAGTTSSANQTETGAS
jgi:hypothetical protein